MSSMLRTEYAPHAELGHIGDGAAVYPRSKQILHPPYPMRSMEDKIL